MKSTYVMQEIPISELKPHPKNPRKITPGAKKRLKEGLDKHGLVQPIIWNKRTGFIVGGHQRFSILKEDLEKDATLNVAVIDVDEKQEAELLVFLNNTSSQGHWDDSAILDLMNSGIADNNMLGFNDADMSYFDKLMKDDAERNNQAAAQYFEQSAGLYDELKQDAEENKEAIEEDKQTRKDRWIETTNQFFPEPEASLEENKSEGFRETRESWKKQPIDSTRIVKFVFRSEETCHKWLQEKGLPDKNIFYESEI